MTDFETPIIKDSLRPTFSKGLLVILFLAWQYFYSYMGYKAEYLEIVFEYLGLGLGIVNWDNYFIRSIFMVILWLLVAMVIFVALWISQSLGQKRYKQSPSSLDPLAEVERAAGGLAQLLPRMLVTMIIMGGYFLVFFGFAVASDFVESLRSLLSDGLLLNLSGNDVNVSYGSVGLLVASFLLITPVWYLYAAIISMSRNFGLSQRSKFEIEDDHFAVVVDESSLQSEE